MILMIITATEAQNNLSKFYKIAEHEDVYIERRGGILLKLTKADKEEFMRMKLENLHGCFEKSQKHDFEQVKYERLVKKHGPAKTSY
jgi:PHD/YefM family antitoxin component YafN of YafNO toxin-antitoxin module